MRIVQLDCRWSQDFFERKMQEKYNLTKFTDRKRPVVFMGCYSHMAKTDIMNHQGWPVVIVWSGSDSLRLHERTDFVEFCKKNTDKVFHIAHSHWIQTDLEHWGLPYIDRVVLPQDLSPFKFEPKWGKSIYHYGTERKWYYGTDIVEKLRLQWEKPKGVPNNFHITNHTAYKLPELLEIYKDSFIGIRLTEHDNMALSAIELGLMGRRSIFNGNIPCAINYSEKYIQYEPSIRKELFFNKDGLLDEVRRLVLDVWNKWGEGPDKLLAEEMREFVHDDQEWLETKYYQL